MIYSWLNGTFVRLYRCSASLKKKKDFDVEKLQMVNMDFISFLKSNHPTINNGGDKIVVLDVACGDFEKSFDLYANFSSKIESIVGVDSCFDKRNIPIEIPCITSYKSSLDKAFSRKVNRSNIPFEEGKTFFYIPMLEKNFLNHCECEFQFIICSNFLHFFMKSEIREFFEKMKNVLSQNGYLFISIANEEHSYSQDENMTTFSLDGLKNELEEFFEVVGIQKLEVLNYVLCKNAN